MNGCRQRFLTKFLQVRLEELKKTVEERLEKLDAESIEVEVRETTPSFNARGVAGEYVEVL